MENEVQILRQQVISAIDKRQKLETIKALIPADSDSLLSNANFGLENIIVYAMRKNRADIVKYFLAPSVTKQDTAYLKQVLAFRDASAGFCILHYAVKHQNLDIIKYLIEQCHADIDIKTKDNRNIVSIALSDNITPVESIVKYVADLNFSFFLQKLSEYLESGQATLNDNLEEGLRYALEKSQEPERTKILNDFMKIAQEKYSPRNSALEEYLEQIKYPAGKEFISVKDLKFFRSYNDHSANTISTYDLGIIEQKLRDILALKDVENSQKQKLIEILLPLAIKLKDPIILILLKQDHSDMFEKVKQTLPEEQQQIVAKYLELAESSAIRMREFLHGFGQITYEGGLLTAAQIRSRKRDPQRSKKDRYEFNPTILNEISEFSEFLLLLKKTKSRPITINFVVTGNHWIAGQINIDEKDEVKILLIDSLGLYNPPNELFPSTAQIARECFEIFPTTEHHTQVYMDLLKRLNAEAGCSVFALGDVQRLHTVSRYYGESWFQDMEANHAKTKTQDLTLDNEHRVKAVELPFSFLKGMQSTSLYSSNKLDKEGKPIPAVVDTRVSFSARSKPIGKKSEKTPENLQAEFQKRGGFEKVEGEKSNPLNRRKLNNIRDHNDIYLRENDPKKVEEDMQDFTLAALKRRLAQKSVPKPEPIEEDLSFLPSYTSAQQTKVNEPDSSPTTTKPEV